MSRVVCVVLAVAAVLAPGPAWSQDDNNCRVLDVAMTPSDDLQMVMWIETASGEYVDTVFITEATGRYGLGNRPGRMDFNSGPLWPYGRRTTVAPVWAHRHGETFPEIVFQNGDEDNLSHPLRQSSLEDYYCRPLREGEEQWDTQTCASISYTDKGRMSDTLSSVYPPRSDVTREVSTDHADVEGYPAMNPFDAVSRATPRGGMPYEFIWALPEQMADGQYVAFLEVSKDSDHNRYYQPNDCGPCTSGQALPNGETCTCDRPAGCTEEGGCTTWQCDAPDECAVFGAPVGIPWSDYGLPYRGQPSVVYRVEFELSNESFGTYSSDSYVGYGDPSGLTGDLNPPDVTITSGVDGTGASRVLLSPADELSEAYRFRLSTRPSNDKTAPAEPTQLAVVDADSSSVVASFVASGNNGGEGTVAGYEVRIQAGTPLTAGNFEQGRLADMVMEVVPGGSLQNIELLGLSPNTLYYVGIRAFDECLNQSDIAFMQVATERPPNGEVSACGCRASDRSSAFGGLLLVALVVPALRRRGTRR